MKMYSSFSEVIQYYHEHVKDLSIFNCTTINLTPIREWLKNELKSTNGKDNYKSASFRKQGNVFYKNKKLRKSVEYYNLSLCYAQDSSEEYFLAIANRSAATYELKRFRVCLDDIELCSSSSTFPEHLRSKLHNRKVACLKQLASCSVHESALSTDEGSGEKNMLTPAMKNDGHWMQVEDLYEVPTFKEGENPEFAYASPRIEIRYNTEKGRHVVAKKNISKGDILFIEKAFAFGKIFHEQSKTMNMLKCHHCLRNTYSGIPCKYCAKCIFCDHKCMNESWDESHRWECRSMIGDMWYNLGIAYPAFRAFMKGVGSNFEAIKQNDMNSFGNKEDNYPFFNSLVYNKNKHLDISIITSIVATYLREYTNYFDWFVSQTTTVGQNMDEILKFFESQLGKHMIQFQQNSSIIQHCFQEEPLSLEKEPIACGIFPSVSLMNHSCKPNITNYFVCDTIVVKALVDIRKNDEISNCYGIYYRDKSKNERQNYCSQLYDFECKCVICSDPKNEMDAFDVFVCPRCGLDIPELIVDKTDFPCENCGTNLNFSIFTDMFQNVSLKDEDDIASLVSSLKCRQKFLHRYHTDIQNTYFKLYCLYKNKGNYQLMLDYFEDWLKVEQDKVKQDLESFGVLLYEVGLILSDNSKFIQKAQEFMEEGIRICTLYYPPNIINRMVTRKKSLVHTARN